MTRSSESPVTSHESSEALPGGQPEAKLASEWRPGSQSHRPGPPAGQPEMTVTNTGSSDRHLRRRGPRHLARARHERDRDRASVTSPRRRLCLRGRCQSRGSDSESAASHRTPGPTYRPAFDSPGRVGTQSLADIIRPGPVTVARSACRAPQRRQSVAPADGLMPGAAGHQCRQGSGPVLGAETPARHDRRAAPPQRLQHGGSGPSEAAAAAAASGGVRCSGCPGNGAHRAPAGPEVRAAPAGGPGHAPGSNRDECRPGKSVVGAVAAAPDWGIVMSAVGGGGPGMP